MNRLKVSLEAAVYEVALRKERGKRYRAEIARLRRELAEARTEIGRLRTLSPTRRATVAKIAKRAPRAAA